MMQGANASKATRIYGEHSFLFSNCSKCVEPTFIRVYEKHGYPETNPVQHLRTYTVHFARKIVRLAPMLLDPDTKDWLQVS